MSKSPPAPVRRPPPGPADLQTLVAMRARPRPARLRVGFVECNPGDLTYFRRLLEREVGAPIRPILLRRLPVAARGCDLLVTTFFHIEEVQRKVPSREVLGLVALPDFRTLEEVARLSPTARVVLVCATDEGVRSKARSLRGGGRRRPRAGAAARWRCCAGVWRRRRHEPAARRGVNGWALAGAGCLPAHRSADHVRPRFAALRRPPRGGAARRPLGAAGTVGRGAGRRGLFTHGRARRRAAERRGP